MQGWTATTMHELQEKEAQKDYSIQEIEISVQLKDVC